MSVHVDSVFVDGNIETVKNIIENIKEKLNISESRKVNKFLGFYYEWGSDAKGKYAKLTIEKDVKKLVEGYEKYPVGGVKVQKTPGAPGKTLSNIGL